MRIQVIAPYKTAAHEHAWYSRNCDVGKARIIVFYYSAHTYVVSLSTKLQKRQTSYKEKIKIPNIENILAIIFPLPHVQTFSLILLDTHTYKYTYLYLFPVLKVINFYMRCPSYFLNWYSLDFVFCINRLPASFEVIRNYQIKRSHECDKTEKIAVR